MAVSTVTPKIVAAAGAAIVLGLGLGTYTLPNHGGPTYGDIHDFIGRALGDSQPVLPGPIPELAVQTVSPSAPEQTAPSGASRPRWQPTVWVTEARARDSAALRAWLGRAVLVTAQVDGDTVRTTFWRLTLHRGCPWISRLRATSTGPGYTPLQLISLTADCPGPAAH